MPSSIRNIRLAALAAALLAVCRAAAFGASTAAPRALTGHVPPQVRGAARLARVAAAENVELSLVVAVDQALMDRTLAELYGPNGSGRRLTPAEFAQKFDLARKRQALKDFAAAAGLTVDPASDQPESLVVKVSGPARLVESAFGVQLHHYRAADGQVFRGHDTDPVIPGALSPHLRAVMGLSNYRGARKPHLHFAGGAGGLPLSAAASPSVYPGTGPGGFVAPADVKSIYGLSLPLTGSGQTVALLELDGYNTTDISNYKTQFGLANTPVTFVGIDGQANLCGPSQNLTCNATTFNNGNGDGGMTEVALDIDMVLALAPGITQLLVYTAPNTGQGLIDAYNKMAVDNTAKSISTSWGLDEMDSGGAFMAAEASIFQQMAVNGQTIFAASGDGGAYDNDGASTPLIVVTDDPASQPYVSGVGGTTLTGSIASHSEAVWNEGCAPPGTNCRNNGAGGGGIANYTEGATAYFPLPSYQSGVAGSASQSFRNVPDVALSADPNTFPYAVSVGGAFWGVGGTSAAAPLWGAMMALINQKRSTNGYGSLGFANPVFYQLGAGGSYTTYFNDIQTGNNGFYGAGPGYDNATGWGSFKADALIGILGRPLAPAAAVSNLAAITLGVSSIQYTWSAVSGATGYDVYYATNSSQALAVAVQPPFTQTGLLGNESSGIFVFAENQGSEGPGAFITTATYAAAPGAPAAASAFVSSATFTYASCPAFPAASSCSGYMVQASTAANFSGATFSTATTNRALLTLSFPPNTLASLTGYFMRLGYLNPRGAASFEASGSSFFTGSSLAAPVSPVFDQVTTGGIRFNWGQGGNPGGLTYSAQASTAANYTGTLLTMTGTPLQESFGGLTADTSYFFRVQALGGPFLTAGPQATLAAAPAVSTNSFPAVGANGLTLAWSGANDQTDTLYQADLSPDPTFVSGTASSKVRATSAAFAGLIPNTAYYGRVSAIGRLGGVVGPVALGSTTTLVLTPTAQAISALGTNSLSLSFNSANPAGTRYLVQVSTDLTFSPVKFSLNTTALSAAFSGLASNQAYSVGVAALNQAGSLTAFVSASTVTLAAAPLPAAIPVTTFTATTFGFAWNAGTLAPGTTYVAQISSSPVFNPGFILTVSTTGNTSLRFSGLQPNTTYYGQVQSQPEIGNTNPSSAFLAAATGATLPNAPVLAGPPFTLVTYTSATVAWKALPVVPLVTSSAAAEGYLVQFATAPGFTTISASSAVGPAASAATVSGLVFATPYFARVGAVGWEGAATFLALGSTTTALPPLSSGTVTGSGLTLTMPRAFPALTSVSVFVPPGAFPPGTSVSVVTTLGSTIPGARSNESGAITPFGPAVGIDLSAGGLQPAVPVRVMMGYDPTQVPSGVSERQLLLWRYDVESGQWTLVPSQVDTVGHMLTAYTPHFSTFAPFFVAAGTDVDAVQVFPQPWEIGDAASQYWSSALTFSGLPASATVKIFTVTGELVWSGTASGAGVLTWNGNNRFGRRSASGTYYASFQSGGKTKVRRLVLIR